ncbi:alpha-L-arabinofuranosidase [Lachnotalea glycerini]|uniref:non-reducing end alpha-L-arabinofuranosidase n=1 Tax=Lachnotalea glycerini TaxID=1763509 RepID=A0A318ENI3_9FIRM|nr:alpha-L-arabinofuranosidase C-terminal domain-containing protein [Lachnotalea glycerini]PXV86858.1 alpha-L-arabinofuranosidase [Lachnotalea glycerini]
MVQIKISEKKRAVIATDMIGLFFEDINYAADGGLYAEMLENKSFEFLDAYGDKGDYYCIYDGGYGWKPYPVKAKADMLYVTGSPVAEENPHYLRFVAREDHCGFSNQAYEGIVLEKEKKYKVSFYARSVQYHASVTVAIKKDEITYASSQVVLKSGEAQQKKSWNKYELELTANADIEGALFVITLEKSGIVEFDFISMIPSNAVAGIFRNDIFEMLQALKPGFIRFPGGCIVEGNTLSNRYRYKDTLKPIEQRKNNWNRWAVHGNEEANQYHSRFSHYNQSLGIGYYEYFLLCELLGAKPLPVLHVGLACQYQSFELVEPETEEFMEYIQDALDLIEFANGDVTTQYGALRAKMGHKQPFGLELIGIGNEQWETDQSRFFERYIILEKAIHECNPSIQLIGSAGPDITSDKYHKAWEFYHKESLKKNNFVYAVDEHYYVNPQWFYENTDFYDNYDRNVKVFAGEYAAHPKKLELSQKNTLGGALSEAAFLTGIERNADVVVLASYAPLLAREGYAQWAPDMIWFDAAKVYATPSYYVQMLYSKYKGSVTLDTLEGQKALIKNNIYYNIVQNENTGDIYVKIVNANEETVTVELVHEAGEEIHISEIVYIGDKDKDSCNSLKEPFAISPSQQIPKQRVNQVTLKKNSFTVLTMKRS